jgi:Domain of unknown function (DUF4440)
MTRSKLRFPEPGQRHSSSLRASVSPVVMLFCIFLMMGCMGGGEPKHPTWKNAAGAEQYERLMWQGIRDQDWKNVEYHLAPTFVGVNASGQSLDRAAWVGYWKTMQIKDFSMAEVTVQPAGADMVVTYILHPGGSQTAPAAFGAGLRVVSVWQQVKHGWILATTAMTPLAPT